MPQQPPTLRIGTSKGIRMGRAARVHEILDAAYKLTPEQVSAAEMADYAQSMLAGLIEMNVDPSAELLRNILWLAKVEAQRLRDEAKSAQGCRAWKRSISGELPKS